MLNFNQKLSSGINQRFNAGIACCLIANRFAEAEIDMVATGLS
jgi:hypothetical protein